MLVVKLKKHKRTFGELVCLPNDAELPRRGESFVPIPFGRWVHSLRSEMRGRDWKLGRAEYAVGNYYGRETELVGSIDFADPDRPPPAVLSTWSLGFAISNGGRHRPRFYFGGRFAGGDGFASARWDLPHRDVAEALPASARDVVSRAAEEIRETRRGLLDLVDVELGDGDRDRMIARIGREGMIPWSRLSTLDGELRSIHKPTLRDFLRAFGAAAGKNTPLDQLDQLWRAWGLLVGEVEARAVRG